MDGMSVIRLGTNMTRAGGAAPNAGTNVSSVGNHKSRYWPRCQEECLHLCSLCSRP